MKCICVRCGHGWESRIAEKPRACPSCKSYKWETPKKDKLPLETVTARASNGK